MADAGQGAERSLRIRPLAPKDRVWARSTVVAAWGGETVVVHDSTYTPSGLPGFLALRGARRVGLITYVIAGSACEIVTLNSLEESRGVGSALIDAVQSTARRARCTRLWLVTTNDNLRALRFYQKRGFHLAALYPGAVEESRRRKPQIPLLGNDGIPLRDEIELEMILAPTPA